EPLGGPDAGLHTWFMAPLPCSIAALLDGAPPDRPALIAGDRVINYGSLARESRCIAGALAALGIGAGDRVAVWLPNVPEWLGLYFALSRLGAIAVAVNTRFRSAELGDILARSGCRALALDPGFRRGDFAGILAGVDPGALERVETIIVCGTGGADPGKRC